MVNATPVDVTDVVLRALVRNDPEITWGRCVARSRHPYPVGVVEIPYNQHGANARC